MGGIPNLSFTGGAASGGTASASSPFDQGSWTINLGGSGTTVQAGSGTSSLSPLLIAALCVGAAWLILRDL